MRGHADAPPESLPIPSGDPPAAMIAASPLLLAPGERAMSYGLRVPPCRGFQLSPPVPPGRQFVLPIRIGRSRIRAITVASRSGCCFAASAAGGRRKTRRAKMSLAVNGTPCRGPERSCEVPPIRRARLLQRALGGGKNHCVQARVDGVDVLEVRAHDLDRGDLPVRMARASQVTGAPMMSLIYESVTLRRCLRV